MAATITNGPSPFPKLTRGVAVKLGTITAQNSAVSFTISEPTFQSQGFMCIQMVGGTTPTGLLEASLDGGTTWFLVTLPTVVTTAAFGDTATTGTFSPINIGGLGSGALFRFGRSDANGGATAVWALMG